MHGNYTAAKKRGIVGGVDFGYTGEVRFVQVKEITQQLDMGNIVAINNIGVSVIGELLNCNSYTVACCTATKLGADKLICMFDPLEVGQLGLPTWMPLGEAERYLVEALDPALYAVSDDDVVKGTGVLLETEGSS